MLIEQNHRSEGKNDNGGKDGRRISSFRRQFPFSCRRAIVSLIVVTDLTSFFHCERRFRSSTSRFVHFVNVARSRFVLQLVRREERDRERQREKE